MPTKNLDTVLPPSPSPPWSPPTYVALTQLLETGGKFSSFSHLHLLLEFMSASASQQLGQRLKKQDSSPLSKNLPKMSQLITKTYPKLLPILISKIKTTLH
jgi:hypothetical protein